MFAYSVACEFSSKNAVAVRERWLEWLENEHLAEVIAGGAIDATVYVWDGSPLKVEVVYRFPDRSSFEIYERDSAPSLRGKGIKLFPPVEYGLSFTRRIGSIALSNFNG